jgi:PKHD-type hydroxylase
MSIKKYTYCVYEKAIPEIICNQITKQGLVSKGDIGVTYASNKNIEQDPDKLKKLYSKRDSNIAWLKSPWIYKEIVPFLNDAMEKFEWNFEISFIESCQFTIYNQGQYYGWHKDSYVGADVIKKNHGRNRKLSVSLLLNDPEEYEGGDLEFIVENEKNPVNNKVERITSNKRGTLIIFPSYVYHQVLPVTKGIRYSLVIWGQGKEWQ